MTKEEIQQKVKELQLIMSQYKNNLGTLEKELFQAVSDYQKSLDQERIKEIRQSLNI
jgi:hypothetical protein